MNTRYVPPHLRKKTTDSSGGSCGLQEETTKTQDLSCRKLSDLKLSEDDFGTLHSSLELQTHYGSSVVHGTLHNSIPRSKELAYVVLYHGANPLWEEKNIIFAHSNIDLLPGYKEFSSQPGSFEIVHATAEQPSIPDESVDTIRDTAAAAEGEEEAKQEVTARASSEEPDSFCLPVFKELAFPGRKIRRNAFHGFFKLEKIEFLKPRSPELIRMLERKWESENTKTSRKKHKKRNAAAWQQSLSQEWAVIKLNRVPKSDCPEEPIIASLPDEAHENHAWRAYQKDEVSEEQSGGREEVADEEE